MSNPTDHTLQEFKARVEVEEACDMAAFGKLSPKTMAGKQMVALNEKLAEAVQNHDKERIDALMKELFALVELRAHLNAIKGFGHRGLPGNS